MAAPTGVGLFHKILVLFITTDTKFALITLNDLKFGLKLRLLACVSIRTNLMSLRFRRFSIVLPKQALDINL